MKRRCRQVSTLFMLIILFVGCGNLIEPSPREILSKYLDASLHGRYEDAYRLLSSKNHAVKSMEKYLSENESEWNQLAEALSSKVTYEIGKIKIVDNQATATAETTLLDFTTKESFVLIKEGGDWKVFLNWEREEKQTKARALLAKAEELKKAKKFMVHLRNTRKC